MFGFSLLNSGLLSLSISELEITITTIYTHRTVCRYLITNISGLSLRGGGPGFPPATMGPGYFQRK